MKIDRIPEARKLLDEWFVGTPKILHEWTDTDTFYLTILHRGMLYSLRVFKLADTWAISMDRQTRIYWPDATILHNGQLYVLREI